MRLLVLSDLHVGESARTKDLCPYPSGENKDNSLVPSFFESITKDIGKYGTINYVIISGDMTNRAQIIEYECFGKFIEELSTAIKVDIDNFIFTPGNHDVNWGVFKEGVVGKRIGKIIKYDTIRDSRFHLLGAKISRELFEEPYFEIKQFDDTVFVIYNSSWHDDPEDETHFGNIEDEHLDALKGKLSEIQDEIKEKIKIFVTHHHPYQYPNLSDKEFSCMQNGGALLQSLSEFSFDFIVHGHKHVPHFYHFEINNLPKINMLSSGSYSNELPTDSYNKSIANLYHVIDFDDIRERKGKILSKAYNPVEKRWVESGNDNHGIDHINHFGCKLSLTEIQSIFEKELSKLKQGEFIRLDKLEVLNPEIKYLSYQAKTLLVSRIEESLGLSFTKVSGSIEIFVKL